MRKTPSGIGALVVAFLMVMTAPASAESTADAQGAGAAAETPLTPVSIGLSDSHASTEGGGSADSSPVWFETSMARSREGSQQSGTGSSSKSLTSTPMTPVGSADAASSRATVEDGSSSATTSIAHLESIELLGTEAWILRSDATAKDGAPVASTDTVLVRSGDHELRIMHAGTDDGTAVIVVDEDGYITDEDAAGRCVIDLEAGVAVNCLNVSDGDTITAARFASGSAANAAAGLAGDGAAGSATATDGTAGGGVGAPGGAPADPFSGSPIGNLPFTGGAVGSMLVIAVALSAAGFALLELRRRFALI